MANQSATRLLGDRYQHLYSWYEILRLLDEPSSYNEAWIEHPEAGAADDLTLHSNDGTSAFTRFIQVKFHVDYRDQYTFGTLLEGTRSSKPVLPGLFAAWRRLRGSGAIELRLVSNWHPAPHPDIGAFIGEGRKLLDNFFTASARSAGGAKRELWRTKLEATDEEIEAFGRSLRFELSYGDLSRIEEQLDDRMGRYGLKEGRDVRALIADEMFARIAYGGDAKKFTRDTVLDVVRRRDLRASHPGSPDVRLFVHAWAKQAFDVAPTIELDWTSRFDRDERRVASSEEWKRDLLPELRQARDRFAGTPNGKYVDLRGKVPLTASLAIGSVLSETAGFKLRVEQPTGGETHLWRSDAAPSDATLQVVHEEHGGGEDLVVGVGISGSALAEIERFQRISGISAAVYVEPASGPGNQVIRSAADVTALALAAREIIRKKRAQFRATRVHLILYAPSSFAVFLGQRLNALGTIVTYERASDGTYQCSAILQTG